MKRVLIVDDDANNRMLLRITLQEYGKNCEDGSIDVVEAENGAEAVALAGSEAFDLILMDIMMPEMDGIEATRNIRRDNKEVMIIAVSAIEDEGQKKEILNAGAEDYISKPVDINVFNSRLKMYFSLIDSRYSDFHNEHAANLYTNKVFSHQMLFSVYNDDSLSEFWEYFLLVNSEKYDGLSDVVRAINAIATLYLSGALSTRIIVEESAEALYFTIEEIGRVDASRVNEIVEKNGCGQIHRSDNRRLSFMLMKGPAGVPELSCGQADPLPAGGTTVSPAAPIMTSASETDTYEYLEPEDLAEIEGYIGKLDSLFLVAGESDLIEEDVVEIYSYLERIGSILTTYSECFVIGQAITALSQDISANAEMFQANSVALAPMCAAFSRDLTTWVRMMFYDGSPSIDYMDDTIVANTQMIGSMLKTDEASGSDDAALDDIFDF